MRKVLEQSNTLAQLYYYILSHIAMSIIFLIFPTIVRWKCLTILPHSIIYILFIAVYILLCCQIYIIMTKLQFAKRLKELRAKSGLSQSKICTELKITQKLYEYYESENNSRVPTYKNLIKLADFFNCSIDYLLCRTDNPIMNL